MACDVITLGEVAARDVEIIEIRWGRGDGPRAARPGGRLPNKDSAQIQKRCGPYSPDLPRLSLGRVSAT
jgi:hypothetical protein